jgi:hypothetical protein
LRIGIGPVFAKALVAQNKKKNKINAPDVLYFPNFFPPLSLEKMPLYGIIVIADKGKP